MMIESTSKALSTVSLTQPKIRVGLLGKIISCLIPFIPLFIYYNIPLTSLSMDTAVVFAVSLFIAGTIFLGNVKVSLGYCKHYLFLLIWTLIITTIYYFLNHYSVNYGIGLWYIVLVFLIIFGVKNRIVDNHLIIKTYKVISTVAIVLIVIQWIVYLFSDVKLSFMFFFLPFNEAYPLTNTHFINTANTTSNFAAFFSERSHFCLFVTPFLCMTIYNSFKKPKKIIYPIIVTLCVLSTTSGNGIIVSAIAWLVMIMFLIKGRKKYIFLFFAIIIAVFIYLFLRTIPEFENIFDTLFRGQNQFSHSKSDYRIYRGLDYYSQLPFFNQLFGIGYRCLDSSFNYYNLIEHYNTSGEYMGCFCQILVYTGALGVIAFLLFAVNLLFEGNAVSKTILICFLAYCLSSSIYYDSVWILYLSIIISMINLISNKEKFLKGA